MPPLVHTGATIACSFGAAPSTLNALPKGPPTVGGTQAATVMDFAPGVNIPPFGMCMAPTNPAVIAATSAALGVFTPAPCVPVITGPWKPGAMKVKINNFPALHSGCMANCAWLGVITVSAPGGNMKTQVT